ncbi:DsbA family protein [Sneathiella litorea]|uniref:Thioredoxin domain-containing protein n=1 Tax=Sneathiella litorea TaxID=2606216 RepID=A0A6L8W5E4_9PROT|nr:DsbA family protein [Sneathiella litorea]MZR30356.1 thioredoxin domain-containing protein [Sneathiella litorea]
MSARTKLSSLSIFSLVALIGLIAFGAYQYAMTKPVVSEEEFGARVRAYLLSNPQVLREVIAELSKQEEKVAAAEQENLISSLAKDLKEDGYSFVAGNPDGDVTIVEFFDYRCGYCKKSFPEVMKTVEMDGNIRLVLKEFPILGADSFLASQAAIASLEQNKYFEFHTALMESRGGVTIEGIRSIAADIGLDVEKLEADMKKDEVREVVEKNYELAKQLGISGTPAFVIGDQFVPGALSTEQMLQLVAEVRDSSGNTSGNDS